MRLFFRSFGSGKPLIILHGLFGLSDNWVTAGRGLSDQFRVIIPDARNHGQSPRSDIFDFPSMEEDLLTLLDELGLKRVSIIGHSLGGKTAMFFALHHPEMVSRLVVVDISTRRYPPNTEHLNLLDAMEKVDFSKAGSRAGVDKQLGVYVESARLRQFMLKNIYWRTQSTLDWRLNLKAIRENLFSVFEGVESNGVFPGPVLFIRGGRSNYIREEDWEDIKRRFPGAVMQTIAEATHWVHADAPGEFLEMVRSFLDQ